MKSFEKFKQADLIQAKVESTENCQFEKATEHYKQVPNCQDFQSKIVLK
jgi:hypothetical protein